MHRILVGGLLIAGLGCQQSEAPKPAPVQVREPAPAVTAQVAVPYRDDIDKLCNVLARSGADQMPEEDRTLPIANWLAANLTTPESRQFLVRIQPLDGEPKAQALDDEARRVGLSGCALAAEWRKL